MNERDPLPSVELTEYLHRKASHMLLPLSGTFELSPVCNFSCRMCYVRKTPKQVRESPRQILTLEDWRAIARQAKEAGTLYLLLTGGEPLLWPDFWTLYEELVDMGFLVSINTNGSLIDEAAVARFRRRPPRRVNITLYGGSDETYFSLCGAKGVFSKVDRAIRSLREAGIPVKLNCSLTPYNQLDLEWIVTYARDRDLRLALVTYMFPPVRRDAAMTGVNYRFTPEEAAEQYLRYLRCSRDESEYRQLLRNILDGAVEPPGLEEGCIDPVDGKLRCRAGKASYWITWDGWMTPCGMMPEPKVDLTQADFSRCWGELCEAAAALRLSGVCGKCPNQQICHACAAIAYTETGSVSGIPTYMCRFAERTRRVARQELEASAGTG